MADRDIRFKLSAEDTTKAAFRSVEAGFKRIKSEADSVAAGYAKVGSALAAIGVSGGFIAGISAGVTGLADLDDAAQKSGASVESLSSLLNTLSPTGVSLSQISDLASKLTKAMVGADEETSKAAEAFKLLGVSTKDGAGNLRSVDDVLVDVARSLAGYRDGTNKAAIAQALLGKSGTEYLPVLKDLAEFQREAATVTAEQATAAADLQDAFGRLVRDAKKFREELVNDLVPGLADFLSKLRSIAAISANPIKWGSFLFGSSSDINAKVSEVEADIARMQGLIDGTIKPEGGANQRERPGGEGLLGNAIAAIAGTPQQSAAARTRLLELQRDLQELKAVQATQRQLGVSTAQAPRTGRSLLFDNAGYGLAPDKPETPRLSGEADSKAAKAAADAIKARRELQALIDESLARDTLNQEANAAKELATQLERAASAALSRIAANDRAEQDADEGIRRDVEAIKDAVEPTRALYRELERVRELTSAGLLPTDAGNARMMQLYSQIDQILLDIPERAVEAQNAMQGLLAPIESAFEAAIFQGEKLSDLLSSLAQDIARLTLRQQITGPLSSFLSGSFDAKKEGGTIFGQLLAGITGSSDSGPELLNAPIKMSAPRAATKSAGVVMVNQTITYGNNGGSRAEAFAFGQAVKADTIRAIKESEARDA